ncbi:MAG: hypothetical protein HZC04_01430 [Candidatus Lloydbacteria bacterium]|nr:hypothetical protein [Candidatus Lloydbacteria bacterium]
MPYILILKHSAGQTLCLLYGVHITHRRRRTLARVSRAHPDYRRERRRGLSPRLQ